MRQLSTGQARRIALGAQGLSQPRPRGRIDRRHFRRVIETIGLLQLDSVNVLQRSHYLPMWSRLGPYSTAALDRYTSQSGELFEYWGHEASLLPVRLHRLMRWRMDEIEPGRRARAMMREHPDYLSAVREEIAAHGPLTVADLSDPGTRTGPWWGHGKGKVALDWLFATGEITAYRIGNFVRAYDLPERVIAPEHLDGPTPSREAAYHDLLLLSARHHGVGTAADLGDYYRLHIPTARRFLTEMVRNGELEAVGVEGWRQPAFLHPEATLPRRITASTLLSPFDPVVWKRDRAERLFGFSYRIEIYVPRPDRVYGYYVLPFLLGERLVGRVDLKSDRKNGVLLVRGAFCEPGTEPGRVAEALMFELRGLSEWLGLGDVAVGSKGNLVSALRSLS